MLENLRGPCKAVVLLSLMVATTGCFGSAGGSKFEIEDSQEQAPAGPAQPGGIFRWATTSDAPSLDPLTESTFTTHQAVGLVYSKLVDYKSGPNLPYGSRQLEGDLAASWEASPDKTTWTFHLRKGVTFHDKPPLNGREFTSEDVACTIEAIQKRGQQRADVSTVANVETPDRYTAVFNLSRPYPIFDYKLAGHYMWMLPCEATEGQVDLAKEAIGTGPFELDKWAPEQVRVYSKNPNYYESGRPYLDGVRVTIIPDTATAVAAVRTKSVDYVSSITDEAMVQQVLESNPDLSVFNELSFTPVLVYMNQAEKPFDDLRVRKAVAYAIDRKNMMEAIRPGGLLSGPVTPKLFGGLTPGEAASLQPYSPGKSRQLLKEAGYPHGFKTELLVTDGYGDAPVREAQWIQQDLAKVGIKAKIDMQDYATYFTESFAGEQYAMGSGLQTPFLTADEYLTSMWHSQGPRNWFNINDSRLDAMIDEQRSTLDPAKRRAEIERIQRYILENVANPYILYTYESVVLYGSYVQNMYPAPDYGSRHLKDVWLAPSAPGRS